MSDPLDGKRKRLNWNEVFSKNGKVRFHHLRTVSVKPYAEWNDHSKARERKEDIWMCEEALK